MNYCEEWKQNFVLYEKGYTNDKQIKPPLLQTTNCKRARRHCEVTMWGGCNWGADYNHTNNIFHNFTAYHLKIYHLMLFYGGPISGRTRFCFFFLLLFSLPLCPSLYSFFSSPWPFHSHCRVQVQSSPVSALFVAIPCKAQSDVGSTAQ